MRQTRMRQTAAEQYRQALLEQWLSDATRGLCKEAKGRVREEVTEHYRDGYESGRAEGKTPMQAHAAVMVALGDARKARREFRKSYLSAGQAEVFERYSKPGCIMLAPWSYFIVQGPVWLLLSGSPLWAIFWCWCVAALAADLILVPRLSRAGKWRFVVVLRTVSLLVVYFLFAISIWVTGLPGSSAERRLFLLALSVVFGGMMIVSTVRLWVKLPSDDLLPK